MDLNSISVHASPDLLGYRSRPNVLLCLNGRRLGCRSYTLRHDHVLHWGFLPIWRRLPRQLSELCEGLLGTAAWDCRRGRAHPTHDVSRVLLFFRKILSNCTRFLYCIKVYVQSMWSDDATDTTNSTGLPSFTTSIRTQSIRAVYRRVRRVLWLQWRSITIVIFLLVDIIFFSIIWVQLDGNINRARSGDLTRFMPYLLCLFESNGDKDKCFALGQDAVISEKLSIALLMLISLSGVQTGLMMSRSEMYSGWYEFFKDKFTTKREFVSLDAKRFSSDVRTYELIKIGNPSVTAPASAFTTRRIYSSNGDETSVDSERQWRKPTMSFAGPQAPSNAANRMDWEMPNNAGARGGLGLHPPRSPSIPSDSDGMDNKI